MPYLVSAQRRLTPEALETALASAPPGTWDGLSLWGSTGLGAALADVVLASGHLRHLRSLVLTGVEAGDAALAGLLGHEDARGLRSVLLGGIPREALGLAPAWGQRWAMLATSGAGDETLAALARLPALERVDLGWALASAEGWRGLAGSALPPRLTAVGTAMAALPEDAAAALVRRAPGLVGLGLSCCGLGDEVLAALAQARPRGLRRLVLALNTFSPAGVATLVDARLPAVTDLDLQGLPLDEGTLVRLAGLRGWPALRCLRLDARTCIETGGVEVWTDQGVPIGESPETLALGEARRRWFAGWTGELRDDPSPWPEGWLPREDEPTG